MPSPAHEAYVASMKERGRRMKRPSPEELAAIRAADAAFQLPAIAGVQVEAVSAGGVPAVWVSETGARPTRTIVYFHGGGFIYFTAPQFAPSMAGIARAADARVLGLDYRRAPEHTFPAPVEDAVAAYRWLLDQGTPPERIAFAGDSAGGGLVVIALLALRDQGLPLPAAGAAISPWTDLKTTGASAQTADDPLVGARDLAILAEVYLGGADPAQPYASPLYADLAGLPPLHVQVGTRESLLDDSLRFVERARAAGVEVESLVHPEVAHMWTYHDPEMPESLAAFAAIGAFLKSRMR